MKNKKISLFPQNYEADILCKYKNEMENTTLESVILCQGSNKKTVINDESILRTEDVDRALYNADVLVLCDDVCRFGKKCYVNRINDARKLKKEIYVSSYLYEWLGEENFAECDVKILNDVSENRKYMMNSLIQINCPVISILGLGENCDKFATLLSMRKHFKDKDYKVLAISGNPMAKFFGCEVLPGYMYSAEFSIATKILKINRYIHELVDKYEPDIVIISHAGGFVKLNDCDTNYFGEISHILSEAIESDLGIVCTYCGEFYSREYYEYLAGICKNRFGIDVMKFLISKQNWKLDAEWKKTEFFFYNDEYFKKNILSKISMIEGVAVRDNENEMKQLVSEIVEVLSNNVEIL